ncbi:Protein of unknown function DUF761, plant [Dillenia turbinata]|uniref:DUF4408 domain-containing protein n=1 Tax=Dillenia turbinata TaxID=194707 RepID=A0AAN8ZU64_9MAGN
MDKAKKSQLLKLSLIAILISITPLLSHSLRSTYLYFIINLLIIALGAEAGLLSSSRPPEDKRPLLSPPKPDSPSETSTASNNDNSVGGSSGAIDKVVITSESNEKKAAKAVEKCGSEKIVGSTKMHKVRKCPSTPSLFFIGSAEPETVQDMVVEDNEEEVEEVGGLSGQELFTKAEIFIGNFYKQLKMQREDSWKRLHGFIKRSTD